MLFFLYKIILSKNKTQILNEVRNNREEEIYNRINNLLKYEWLTKKTNREILT